MKSYKELSFQDRTGRAADAKAKALEQLRSRPPIDPKVRAERMAKSLRRDAAKADKAAARTAAKQAATDAATAEAFRKRLRPHRRPPRPNARPSGMLAMQPGKAESEPVSVPAVHPNLPSASAPLRSLARRPPSYPYQARISPCVVDCCGHFTYCRSRPSPVAAELL